MSLRSRWRAARADRTLEQEIDSLRDQLDRAPIDDPERGGFLNNNLGNRLRDRYLRTGDVADLASAIEHYRAALDLDPDPTNRRLASANLAVALMDRYGAAGDLADLGSAVEALQEAAAAAEPGSPERARHLANLAWALNERYERTRQPSDIEAAISSAEEALELAAGEVRTAAVARLNLAAALGVRGGPDDLSRAADLASWAEAHFPEGTPEHQQARLVVAMTRAGPDSGELGLESDDATLATLIETARQAPAGSPRGAMAQRALGRARWAQYERTGDHEHLDAAIAAFQAAVDGTSEDSADLPRYLNDLGRALTELSYTSDSAQGLAQALAVWMRALLLLEDRFGSAELTYTLGQQSASIALGLAERVVSTYLVLADAALTGQDRMRRDALVIAERSKSRLLTDVIGRGDLPAPAGVPDEWLTREQALVEELKTIDTVALAEHAMTGAGATSGADRGAGRRVVRQELDELWEEIAASGESGQEYVALRRRPNLSWDTIVELQALVEPGTALASLFLTNQRALLFVVPPGRDAPGVCEVEIDRAGWLEVVDLFDREVRGAGSSSETWDQRFQPLLRAALPVLEGVERVVLAPAAWGLQLPWATIARRAGWRTPDDRPLPIVTVESLGLLRRLLAREPAPTGGGVVVVGDPTGDLEHAEAEAEEIGETLGVEPILGAAATKEAVMAGLRSASMVHIAGHARFNVGAPLDSGIAVADGVITARDVLSERIHLDLLVLSACETGTAESLGGYEYAGLTQAFQVAGARCVVASLWKVDDPVTAVLMDRFYESWRQGADLARALSDAMDASATDTASPAAATRGQRELVDSGPSAGTRPPTYYWDSFVISGDWTTAPPFS